MISKAGVGEGVLKNRISEFMKSLETKYVFQHPKK